MSVFRKLASQTAVYGIPTILGRFLNYLLVPLYLSYFAPEEYGVVTKLYAWAAALNVLLTYGMETAYFKFDSDKKQNVLGTAINSIIISSLIFLALVWLNSGSIAEVLKEAQHPEYIRYFALIAVLDAIVAVPFASLRQSGKPARFALVRSISIFTNIGLNLLFIKGLPELISEQQMILGFSVGPEPRIEYIFWSNVLSSAITFLFMIPELRNLEYGMDLRLLGEMLRYSLPLMLVGFAGIINETLDRQIMEYLLPEAQAKRDLGIYGANYKLGIIMSLFIQAFRFAAEPFFFSQKTANSKILFARVTHYFSLFCLTIFLGVTLYLDFFKIFLRQDAYYEGLSIVPIILLANVFLGVYFNLSIWYKLTNKTGIGARISVAGAAMTIILNLLLVPRMGYIGAAWATLFVYIFMAVTNYFIGQKHYPIPYKVRAFSFYLILTLTFFLLGKVFDNSFSVNTSNILKTLLFLVFIALIVVIERPKKILTSQH